MTGQPWQGQLPLAPGGGPPEGRQSEPVTRGRSKPDAEWPYPCMQAVGPTASLSPDPPQATHPGTEHGACRTSPPSARGKG
eukprot:4786801-Alexandrium_andersonii.AAC.1